MDRGHAFFAYAKNYLIDTDPGVIVDVEATRAIRQAEVGAARTMLERTEMRVGMRPASLAADSAYGSAESLAWLVKHKGIAPHIPVFDKSNRPMARSPGPISSLTPTATVTPARREKNLFSSDEPMRPPGAASRPRAQDSIVPANWIAMSANSKPSAVRTRSPARSRETSTKTPAMWLVRTPQLRNTWRPVVGGRKSRCCSPTSSVSFASRACGSYQRSERSQRRISPRGHRPKPETTRPT
jgi:hypothetical protein